MKANIIEIFENVDKIKDIIKVCIRGNNLIIEYLNEQNIVIVRHLEIDEHTYITIYNEA